MDFHSYEISLLDLASSVYYGRAPYKIFYIHTEFVVDGKRGIAVRCPNRCYV